MRTHTSESHVGMSNTQPDAPNRNMTRLLNTTVDYAIGDRGPRTVVEVLRRMGRATAPEVVKNLIRDHQP